MKKDNTLPVKNITNMMNHLGLQLIPVASKDRMIWEDRPTAYQMILPVQQGRCHLNTLANKLAEIPTLLQGKPIIKFIKHIIADDLLNFHKNEKDVAVQSNLPTLPRELAKRSLPNAQLKKLLVESGWEMTSKKGSHFSYKPKGVENFQGAFLMVHHGGKEPKQTAQATQHYLSNLNRLNLQSEAKGALLKLHTKWLAALSV